jgi:hypothetical protein
MVFAKSTINIQIQREHELLVQNGFIDEDGCFLSDELPHDMREGSDSDVDRYAGYMTKICSFSQLFQLNRKTNNPLK